MDEKRKEGYVTGLGCLVIFAVFMPIAISTGWNTSGQIFWVFTVLFGGLGFGSLWKPDSVGAVTSQFLRNFARSEEEGSSDSHDSQIQKRSSGSVQVMAHDQSNVNITVHSGKKKGAQNLPEESENLQDEKKETLRKETIVVAPSDGYSYEFDLMKGDHLRGEITSTSSIDVFFVDESSFDKWNRGRRYFEPENSNNSVLETDIDYVAPKKGKWYVLIENNGRKSTTVKVRLY
jgi:hypothetical protein